jgi:hypothetical protein
MNLNFFNGNQIPSAGLLQHLRLATLDPQATAETQSSTSNYFKSGGGMEERQTRWHFIAWGQR